MFRLLLLLWMASVVATVVVGIVVVSRENPKGGPPIKLLLDRALVSPAAVPVAVVEGEEDC